jgi:hypothetical protein
VHDKRGSEDYQAISKGVNPPPPLPPRVVTKELRWNGEVPAQKWMNFYTKVLSKLAGKGLKLTVQVEHRADGEITMQKVEEIKVALRELGLDDQVDLR